jgi:hypothetical protein
MPFTHELLIAEKKFEVGDNCLQGSKADKLQNSVKFS